ncbi:glycosyltransferase family 2 protein [Geminocystis herdmanii]|uniref:glycosyltransferase family 2 protein n=1 Tax=Geminocystis herdmanii TaxID=669359 RepID=UPI00034B5C1E|nr:glycosyltransferase family 2 protein [Geminocystis herdmanii]
MDLTTITPLILTYNEEPNIDRTLSKLTWAKEVIIIDSFSTDKTLEIVKNYENVTVFQRTFDSHSNQWNYGLNQINSEWILSMDADYIINEQLLAEINHLAQNSLVDGYFIPFKYCVFGKPLNQTILPPRQCLFRKNKAIYIDDGHTQLLKNDGKISQIKSYIYHDDRKSLSRWLWAQDRYMILEVEKILKTPVNQLSLGDKIRKKIILAPFIVFFYCLILKGGILDGWHGWYYAFQRMFAEILLSLRLIEAKYFNQE